MITSEQIRAARALLRWEQRDLAEASKVSLPSIKRLETIPGRLAAQPRTIDALRSAIEAAGVEFTNGDQPGVRMRRKFQQGDNVAARQFDNSPDFTVGRDPAGKVVTTMKIRTPRRDKK